MVLPTLAIVGRPNVGKSTILIEFLVNGSQLLKILPASRVTEFMAKANG